MVYKKDIFGKYNTICIDIVSIEEFDYFNKIFDKININLDRNSDLIFGYTFFITNTQIDTLEPYKVYTSSIGYIKDNKADGYPTMYIKYFKSMIDFVETILTPNYKKRKILMSN